MRNADQSDGRHGSQWKRWGGALFSFAALLLTSIFSTACGKGASLDGAWQPDNYGTRVEIAGDKIVVLWRSAPVLETMFTVSQEGKRKVLRLEKTEMWDETRGHAIGAVTGCYVEDGKMHLLQHYEFAGDDEEILEPTTESRYGDAAVITEKMLPRIQGVWQTEDGSYAIRISGSTLESRFRENAWAHPAKIAVVHYNWRDDKDSFAIVPEDPAQHEIEPFTIFEYKKDGKLHARIIVHDADSPDFAFEKVK